MGRELIKDGPGMGEGGAGVWGIWGWLTQQYLPEVGEVGKEMVRKL